MSRVRAVESRSDRAEIARDAGLGKVSLVSVLAGTLVAYGAFAVLAAAAAAILKGGGFDTDLSTQEWRQLGVAGGIIVATVLFLSYLFGGYVAGRMARRAGATNGLLVFVVGVLLMVGLAAVVNMFRDTGEILLNLRTIGVPVSAGEWGQVATVAGLGSLAAMLLGSMVGGSLGERWHGKLVTLAFDPTVGAGVPELPVIMADGPADRTAAHMADAPADYPADAPADRTASQVAGDAEADLARRQTPADTRLGPTDDDGRRSETVGGGRLVKDGDRDNGDRDNIVVRPTDGTSRR